MDRWNRARLLTALALTWTIGTGLTAVAGGFTTLFIARMMTAIGMSGGLTAALSLAADLCRPEQRGRATLIVTVGKTLGQALTFALAAALFGFFAAQGEPAAWMPAWLSGLAPWRATHVALFLIGAVLILPLFLMREPARRETEAGTHAPFAQVVRELWSRRRFLGPLFAGQVSIVMADAAAAIWAAPVLSRSYGVQPAEVAGWMGLLLFGTGLGGAILGGFAADVGQRSGRRGGLMRGAVIAAAVGVPASAYRLGRLDRAAAERGARALHRRVYRARRADRLRRRTDACRPCQRRARRGAASWPGAGAGGSDRQRHRLRWILGGDGPCAGDAGKTCQIALAGTYPKGLCSLHRRRAIGEDGNVKHCIVVSPEMLTFVGPGEIAAADWPDQPVVLRFSDPEEMPSMAAGSIDDLDALIDDPLVLVVAAEACRRFFALVPVEGGSWHLPGDLRDLVLRIRDCDAATAARDTLRLARSIELFCALLERLQRGALVPIAGSGALSELDTLRIANARRMIDEHWHEKLTLESIARACGLNRGKLARGFRTTYDCTVADALTDQRLSPARGMLRSTDLPVKAIGYRCGYLNNASFTRAFSRHFGIAPTQMRAGAVPA